MNQSRVLFTLIITVVLMLGCSSGMQNPVTPSVNGESVNQLTGSAVETPQSPTYLWGYYELYFDVENGTIEATPVRTVEFTANVTGFLNNDPQGLGIKFNGTSSGTGYIDIDMDITIKHPLSAHEFDGYDVRGVFIGDGSSAMGYNSSLHYAANGEEQILLNADGYTRWYNPVDFPTPGIFGYIPGNLASSGYTPTATLNPYKIFGEGLGANEGVWDYLNTAGPEVGYFLAGTSNTRNYRIRFPLPVPGIKYGYAVVANWAGTAPSDHPSHAPEALSVNVQDNSTLYYVNSGTNGGHLVMDIQVFDWDAETTSGVMEDYQIIVESTVLSAPHTFDTNEMTATEEGQYWYMYHVDIPADNLSGTDGNEMWVIIEDSTADYTNPMGVPNNAGSDKIAGCFRYPLAVSDIEPLWVEVTSPNGGEQWKIGGSGEITWDSNPDVNNVAILLSLNSGVDFTQLVTLFTPNDGSFTWDPIPFYAVGTQNRIIIMDVEDTSINDESDDDFTVSSTSVDVTSPDGGEQWKTGTSHDITWDADADIANVKIDLSVNSGSNFILVIAPSVPNTGIFTWNYIPPGIDFDTCRVRVSDIDCPEVFAISDADFEIFEPGITLTSPNGGEELEGYMSWDILWECTETGGTVSLEYSTDDFATDINTIAVNTDNDGNYTWVDIPFDLTDTATVRIVSPSPAMSDVSDSYFSIVEPEPFIRVLSPNGGEAWKCGHAVEVTWLSYGVTGNVNIDYSIDGFVSDVREILDNTPNSESYTWDFVRPDFYDNILVRVESLDNPTLNDVSDSVLSIVDAGWARTWGEDASDDFRQVVVDDDGNSYVAGGQYVYWNENTLAVLQGYDAAGEREWGPLTWGIDQYQYFCGISGLAMDESGYLYVTGSFTGTNVDFDPGVGEDLHSTTGEWDSNSYISKFGSDGTWYWTLTWGGDDPDNPAGIAVQGSNIYVVGSFQGTDVDFDPDPVDTDLHDSNGSIDVFLSKLDTTGDFIWARTWGGTQYDWGSDLAVDETGLVYVSGIFFDTVDFDPGPAVESKSSNGQSDAYLSWLDDDGTFLGVAAWGGTEYDSGSQVGVDGSGNVYVGGNFRGTDVDFDPSAGEDLHTAIGDSDTYLSKFDSSVQYQWMRTWVGLDEESIEGVDFDGSGNVFIIGGFTGQDMDFDPGPGTDLHTSNGEADAYFKMLDSSGNYMTARTWGGGSWDDPRALFVTDAGAIYVAGNFDSGWVEFAQVGSPCFDDSDLHFNNGYGDAFLVKYMPDGCW